MHADAGGFTMFLIFVAVVGGMIALGWFMAEQRKKAMREAAQRLGMTYAERDDSLVGAIADFAVYSRGGRSQSARNALQSRKPPLTFSIFDYHYTTGHGKNSHSHSLTVAHFACDGLNLPKFKLSPENFLYAIGEALGFHDIDFPDQPEFSKECRLVGPDEGAIRRLFSDSVIGWFRREPGVCAEGDGRELVVYRQNRTVRPDDVAAFAGSALELFRALAGQAKTLGQMTAGGASV